MSITTVRGHRPRYVLLGSLITGSLIVAACGPSGDGPSTEDTSSEETSDASTGHEQVIHIATDALPTGLDPAVTVASFLRVFGAGEALLKIQADGSVAPELAESFSATSETEWTVELREGATFWSGEPVTAQAVVDSLERTISLNPAAESLLAGVEFGASDEYTVVFETESGDPWFPYSLSHYNLVIHNAASYTDDGAAVAAADADLTGPFRTTEFATGRELVLERFDEWWGETPTLERITVTEVTDPVTRADMAISGQADIAMSLPLERAAEVASVDGMGTFPQAAAATVTVYLNPNSPNTSALADVRVRQALGWAVDREGLVELLGGFTIPAPTWLASNPAFPEARETGFTPVDVERAEELLDEAGWVLDEGSGVRMKDGERLELSLYTWGRENPTGEILQAQWTAIGVALELRAVDDTLVEQAKAAGDWEMFTEAWTTIGNVPRLIGNQVSVDGSGNYSGVEIPGVPELLETAATSTDEGERTGALLTLNDLITEYVPMIPIHPRVFVTAVSEDLTGFVSHPLQYENIVQPGLGYVD